MATALKPSPTRAATNRVRDRVRAQIEKAKQALAKDIVAAVDGAGLTQVEAFYLTGQQQSQFSLIRHGHLAGFSIERLIEIRAMLGAGVRVTITADETPNVSITMR